MNKLKPLIIAFHFPPLVTAGTYRTVRFVKHLHKYDIDAVVLTVKNPDPTLCPCDPTSEQLNEFCGFPVYRVKEINVSPLWRYPVGLINRLSRLFPKLFKDDTSKWGITFIDKQWGWILPAYLKARRLIRQHNINMIYVSSPPRSSVMIGVLLKKKFNLPLVLDFRDPLMLSSWGKPHENSSRKNFYQRLHENIITTADTIIVVTWSLKNRYEQLTSADKVHLIFNGYDQHYRLAKSIKNDDRLFKIVYLGSWTEDGRSPENLLAALKDCSFAWELISVGSENDVLLDCAKRYHVTPHIRTIASVPKENLYPFLNEATVLFLIQGEQFKHAVASKTMDYLATGKHILAQVAAGDNSKFIRQYTQQCTIVDHDDKVGLRTAIEKIYNAWVNKEPLAVTNTEFLRQFSGEKLTEKFATVMRTTAQKFNQNN